MVKRELMNEYLQKCFDGNEASEVGQITLDLAEVFDLYPGDAFQIVSLYIMHEWFPAQRKGA